MFRTVDREITVRWAPIDAVGLEHLTLSPGAAGKLNVRSTVIGESEGVAYGASYVITIAPDWRVESFRIETTDGRSLAMTSPEPGRWLHADGRPDPRFDGCIDIDLTATPFTNTLPIRRLGIRKADGPLEFQMLFVPFETLEPIVDGQRYTCLEDGRLYRFEALDNDFAADIAFDEWGLVAHYPTLFTRS